MENDNVVEVNGEKWLLKEQKKSSYKMPHGMLQVEMMMAMMMGSGGGLDFGERKIPTRPKIDLVKEYGLIQQKKSMLSRSKRDWVVREFESKFTKIIETPANP